MDGCTSLFYATRPRSSELCNNEIETILLFFKIILDAVCDSLGLVYKKKVRVCRSVRVVLIYLPKNFSNEMTLSLNPLRNAKLHRVKIVATCLSQFEGSSFKLRNAASIKIQMDVSVARDFSFRSIIKCHSGQEALVIVRICSCSVGSIIV
jgi:hypothetical protein